MYLMLERPLGKFIPTPTLIHIRQSDDFKNVNDTFGHSTGDKVLKTIAYAIKCRLGLLKNAVCGRWGGEEFLFLISDVSKEEACILLEDLREEIAEHAFDDVESKTISVGVSQFISGEQLSATFARADKALYEAKEHGKNRVVFQ